MKEIPKVGEVWVYKEERHVIESVSGDEVCGKTIDQLDGGMLIKWKLEMDWFHDLFTREKSVEMVLDELASVVNDGIGRIIHGEPWTLGYNTALRRVREELTGAKLI